ncbi:MAG: DUF3631 domain-containing protein [Acidimicrobiales bacterium]
MSAIQTVLERLEAADCRPRRTGSSPWWSARCPAHDDTNPSLGVKVGDEDQVVVVCQAGCDFDSIVAALKLAPSDFFTTNGNGDGNGRDDVDEWTPAGPAVATYRYVDVEGRVVFGVARTAEKAFRQWQPDPTTRSGRRWNLDGVTRVLYRLPKVLEAAAAGGRVYVVEGEKDVHALESAGAVATTNPGGAGKWRPEYVEALRGAEAVVVADRDEVGRAHARQVLASLGTAGIPATVVEAAEGKDAADHLAAGRGLDDFVAVEQVAATDEAAEEALADLERIAGDVGPKLPPEVGWSLLDAVEGFLVRFVAFPSKAAADAVALWVVHSWALAAAESTPRLALLSAEKRSGKSRLLELLELLVAHPVMTASMSAAALFRTIEAAHPTLLMDEVDTVFGKANEDRNEELRGLLNAGHRRGAMAYRCAGPKMAEVKAYTAFAPVALAGIGELPSTIGDRSITIKMKRRRPDEEVERFRRRKVAAAAARLSGRIEAWATANVDTLAAAEPDLPAALDDRAADGWEPLLAIADAAGGQWPGRARRAALQLSADKAPEDDTAGVRLLADCRTVFDGDRMASADLAAQLAALEDAPWGAWFGHPLDARGLARLLRRYDVVPKKLRDGDGTVRGYERSAFVDAWGRYLGSGDGPSAPSDPVPAEQPEQPEHRRSGAISGPEQASDVFRSHTPSDAKIPSYPAAARGLRVTS